MRLGYDSCTSLLSSVSGINVKIDLGGEGVSTKWPRMRAAEVGTLSVIIANIPRTKLGLVFINWDCNNPIASHINAS